MISRIDVIGQNGNDGIHYSSIGEDYEDKIKRTWADCQKPILNKDVDERQFVKKLVEDHWKYIKGVLENTKNKTDDEINEIEYHYKTAMEHGWRHAKEYYTGSV